MDQKSNLDIILDIIDTKFDSKMQKEFVIQLSAVDGKQINMEVKQKSSKISKRKVKTWTSEEDNQLMELYARLPKKWS